tara:strand:- start:972 stop:2111 length:1140 start_codon:yes stop_codon:yes gene_type:complete
MASIRSIYPKIDINKADPSEKKDKPIKAASSRKPTQAQSNLSRDDDSNKSISPVLRAKIINNEVVTITFRQEQCPGDVFALTPAIRDLKSAFPNLHLRMQTTAPEIWENNPYITEFSSPTSFDPTPSEIDLKLGYPLIHEANWCAKHFIHGFKEEIERRLGVSFAMKGFKCDVHLSEQEQGWMNQVEQTFNYKGKFWVINSGSKNDFPLKQWSHVRWQQVVDALQGKIKFVQVGEGGHNHEPLHGTLNLLGKTDMRQLIRLCYHAQGAVCHVTMLNHLMSAFEKPCVVVAGGRESSSWEAYNETTYLDTVGNLNCCKSGGCWKSQIEECVAMETPDDWSIENPNRVPPPRAYPKCMNLITSADVVRAIERYYAGGRLEW